MPEYNAGDARLRVVPDASRFEKELKAKLKAINVDYTVRVNVALAQAKTDIDRFMRQQDDRRIAIAVKPQLTNARAEMAEFRAEQRTNGITVPVKMDTDNARSQAGALSRAINGALGNVFDIGKTIGVTALVANIPAAVTAVAALGQALGQLSGAALVVPGAIATAGASIGTLAVGLSGVKDAYTAVAAAADESTTGQVERSRAAASATTSLRNAVVDEAQAQKDVANARKDARQELQDLNLELNGGRISEAQAINDAAKARRDLAKGGFKDALEQTDAQLRVAAADQRVVESHQRNIEVSTKKSEADAKGVEGSDQVVAANERVVRSHQAVESAQQSLTDATGVSASAADKANDALAKLSPQAADFVQTLVDLRPRWDDLKKTVSGNLFEGASTSFTQFIDNVLPGLKTGMGSIATAWNSNIKTLLSSLGSDNSKGLLDRILGNTAKAQQNFDKAIDPLVRGIGTLVAAGSDAVPRLATAIGNVAERFATFIDAADKDGRLDRWIDAGLDGFTDLGNILLNLGKSFFSINDAIGGKGLLASLRDVTDKMAAFLGSDAGQAKLREFFTEGKRELDEWKPIVGDLIKALPAIWNGAQEAIGTFMPIIREFAEILADNPRLISDVVVAFAAWKIIDGVTSLYTNVKKISDLLTGMPSKIKGAADPDLIPGSGDPDGKGKNGKNGKKPGKLGRITSALPAVGWIAATTLGTYDAVQDAKDNDTDVESQIAAINNGLPPGIPKAGTPEADQMLTGFAAQKEPGAEWVNAAPGGADGRVEKAKRYAFWASHYNPADPVPFVPPDVGSYEVGGPTKAGLAVLHDKEFVLSNRASIYPDSFKHALNEGKVDPKMLPRFYVGGEYRTDMPPGGGPDPIAPNNAGGGGLFGAGIAAIAGAAGAAGNAGKFGIGGAGSGLPAPPAPAGDGLQVVSAAPNPTQYRMAPSVTSSEVAAAGTGTQHLTGATPGPGNNEHLTGANPGPGNVPGAGAEAPVADAAPASTGFGPFDALRQRFSFTNPDGTPRRQVWQDTDGSALPLDTILGNLPDKLKPFNIAAQFGGILAGGILGFFGLQNSILSPTNEWNQALQKGLGLDGKSGFGAGSQYDPDTVTNILGDGGPSTASPEAAPPGFSLNPNSKIPGHFGDSPPDITGAVAASLGNPTLYPTSGPNAYKVPDWAQKLAGQFGLKASTYADGDTLHQAGYAFDFFPTDPTDPKAAANMDALSSYLQGNLQGQTLQLIHRDVNSGQEWRIAGGARVGPGTKSPGYFNANMAGHGDHVHWATDIAPVFVDPNAPGSQQLAQAGVPTTDANSILYPYSMKLGSTATASLGSDPSNVKAAGYQAYLASGLPPNEWAAFEQLIQNESSWQPTAKNPGSTAYGLGQFLDSTWATVGGSKTDDAAQQLQYIFAYLKQRPDYAGSPAKALALWQSRSPHWYALGGGIPGIGNRDTVPAMLTPGEHVLTTGDVKALGGQGGVYAMRAALKQGGGLFNPNMQIDTSTTSVVPKYDPRRVTFGDIDHMFTDGALNSQWTGRYQPPNFTDDPLHYALGGSVGNAFRTAFPAPRPVVPDAKTIKPKAPAAPSPRAAAPRPSPGPAAPPVGPAPPPGATTPSPAPEAPKEAPQGLGPVEASPDTNTEHLLPAISTGIKSGFAAAGNAAAMAASVAAGAGSFGAGGGAAGSLISGLFGLGGKAATGLAEVGASFLVGNVTPGTSPNGAYGDTYRPGVPAPQTAPLDPGRTYVFNGMDSRNIVDDLRLKDSQDAQATLARYP